MEFQCYRGGGVYPSVSGGGVYPSVSGGGVYPSVSGGGGGVYPVSAAAASAGVVVVEGGRKKLETEGKHKTNGEINEKTKHKRQRELNRPCRMSQHFDDSSICF